MEDLLYRERQLRLNRRIECLAQWQARFSSGNDIQMDNRVTRPDPILLRSEDLKDTIISLDK